MQRLPAFFLSILIFLLIFVGFFHRITAFTQDLGRHLLLGEIIVKSGNIPQNNLLSYTYPQFPFLNHHYLSEIIFYAITQATGLLGLLVFTTSLVVIAFALVFFFCLKKAHIFPLAITSCLLLFVLFERTDLRPEIFSFFLLSLFTTILYRFREKPTRFIFILPPLMLLWVNLHVYFFVGIVLITLFLFDALIVHKKQRNNKAITLLLLSLLLTVLATLINPNLLKGALYPLQAFNNYGYSIEENQNIFFLEKLGFKKQSVFFFKISALLFFVSLIANWKKTKPIDWLLALFFSAAGAIAVRNLPLFVFACFIPFAVNFSVLFIKLTGFIEALPDKKRLLVNMLIFVALSCLLILQTISIGQKKAFGFSVDDGATHAANFFIKNELKGPIFNNFDIGSYLAYRLYPKEKVFVDGRPEAYPSHFFQKTYIPMQQDPNIFLKTSAQYNFNVIFFSHTDQTPWGITFLKNITQDPAWKTIYLDSFVIILVRNLPANNNLVKKFNINLTSPTISYHEKPTIQSLLQLASFFNKIQQPKQEIFFYEKILSNDPASCIALYNIGAEYAQEQNLLANLYASRYRQHCQ